MEIKPLDAAEEEEYQEYVLSSPGGNYCHDIAWKRVFQETYGKEPAYWICRENGRITGAAPAFWLESLLFGRSLVSMPYLDYGGILHDTPEAGAELVETLKLAAASRRAALEIRQERPLADPAPPNHKVKMVLDLRGRREETYWKELDAKVRNQVRKAEKSGIAVRAGGEELLPEFYRVFCVNMRDLGSPVHPADLFRNVLRHLPGAEIVLADHGGYVVGGLVRIHWKDAMIIPWASTLRKYRALCPNNAIYWETLREAFHRGCASVDFGRSTKEAGTYKFKLQWLAKEEPLPWYAFSADALTHRAAGGRGQEMPASVPAPAEEGKLGVMGLAAELWRKLPARYANWLGPRIRGAFSN
jgi:serine/alanine adding enzyme